MVLGDHHQYGLVFYFALVLSSLFEYKFVYVRKTIHDTGDKNDGDEISLLVFHTVCE